MYVPFMHDISFIHSLHPIPNIQLFHSVLPHPISSLPLIPFLPSHSDALSEALLSFDRLTVDVFGRAGES